MARGATIGITIYIFFNIQNNLTVKNYQHRLITHWYLYNTFSGITYIGHQHIQQNILHSMKSYQQDSTTETEIFSTCSQQKTLCKTRQSSNRQWYIQLNNSTLVLSPYPTNIHTTSCIPGNYNPHLSSCAREHKTSRHHTFQE